MIKQLLSNKVVKNAGWLIWGKIVQMIISMVVNLLTARYLGPSNYGLINYAGAYIAFFSSLCTLGITSVIVTEFIKNKGKEGEIIGTALILRLISSILSIITIISIVSVIDANEPTTILVVATSCISVLFNIFDTFQMWFQSQLKSKVTSISILIAYIVTALYKVYLLISEKSVIYFAFATTVDYVVLGALLLFAYKKYSGKPLSFSFTYAKKLLKKSCYFILPGLMVSIYAQTDKMMLKQIINTTEIGYYSTALSICTMWCFVLSAIIDSIYPSIVEAHDISKSEFDKRNRILYAIIFYISMTVSIFLFTFAKPIINILFGSNYAPAIGPFRIITWYTAFSYLGVAKNAWIVCNNKQKYLIYTYMAAAISNILLNLILIPLWGATGAALASLIAQVITVIVAPLFIKDLRENTILIIDAIRLKGLKEALKNYVQK